MLGLLRACWFCVVFVFVCSLNNDTLCAHQFGFHILICVPIWCLSTELCVRISTERRDLRVGNARQVSIKRLGDNRTISHFVQWFLFNMHDRARWLWKYRRMIRNKPEPFLNYLSSSHPSMTHEVASYRPSRWANRNVYAVTRVETHVEMIGYQSVYSKHAKHTKHTRRRRNATALLNNSQIAHITQTIVAISITVAAATRCATLENAFYISSKHAKCYVCRAS